MKSLASILLLSFASLHAQTLTGTGDSTGLALKVTGGAKVETGRVKRELPVLADNGNSVSLKVNCWEPAGQSSPTAAGSGTKASWSSMRTI